MVDLDDLEDLLSPVAKANEQGELAKALLEWYDCNRRLLPWRGDPRSLPEDGDGEKSVLSLGGLDPEARAAVEAERKPVSAYATWVSEIMLQQTRVDTVVAYFNRWMEAFPTVQDLAAATEEQVNSLWAGLGYYRRARNLHAGAQFVANELKGEMPDNVKDLMAIKGIGEYTAGAVASIAFKRAVPLVDGNVIRVFARLSAELRDTKDKHLIKACWRVTTKLVPTKRPGDFNQALMELGATVCTPKAPRCEICPARQWCKAYEENPATVTMYPVKTKAKVLPEETYAVSVLCRPRGAVSPSNEKKNSVDIEFLVTRRPSTGLLAGQWEFVTARAADEPESAKVLRDLIDLKLDSELEAFAPCKVCVSKSARVPRGSFSHTFSHLRHHLHVESIRLDGCENCPSSNVQATDTQDVAWMTRRELADVGLSKATQVCLELALEERKTKSGKAIKLPKKRRASEPEPGKIFKPAKRVVKKERLPGTADKTQPQVTKFFQKRTSVAK